MVRELLAFETKHKCEHDQHYNYQKTKFNAQKQLINFKLLDFKKKNEFTEYISSFVLLVSFG